MKGDSSKPADLTTFGIIGFNFLAVVVHSIAHEALGVKANAAQLAFIIPVIVVAPPVAAFLLPKFKKAGAWLLTLSMLGSFLFGLYYHFVADTIDHAAHVSRLEPAYLVYGI